MSALTEYFSAFDEYERLYKLAIEDICEEFFIACIDILHKNPKVKWQYTDIPNQYELEILTVEQTTTNYYDPVWAYLSSTYFSYVPTLHQLITYPQEEIKYIHNDLEFGINTTSIVIRGPTQSLIKYIKEQELDVDITQLANEQNKLNLQIKNIANIIGDLLGDKSD